jgi:RNA polymerase sigma factor (sigma-70 family)
VSSDAEIYASCAGDLVRFATTLVGPADAADVVSQTMVRVLTSRQWPHVENRRAYLFRSILNEARMHHRATLRRHAREARSAPPESVDDDQRDLEVLERVAQLSLRQRAVVYLVYWDDLDHRSVATTLGISEGSVRRHLARAHGRLKEMLRDVQDA